MLRKSFSTLIDLPKGIIAVTCRGRIFCPCTKISLSVDLEIYLLSGSFHGASQMSTLEFFGPCRRKEVSAIGKISLAFECAQSPFSVAIACDWIASHNYFISFDWGTRTLREGFATSDQDWLLFWRIEFTLLSLSKLFIVFSLHVGSITIGTLHYIFWITLNTLCSKCPSVHVSVPLARQVLLSAKCSLASPLAATERSLWRLINLWNGTCSNGFRAMQPWKAFLYSLSLFSANGHCWKRDGNQYRRFQRMCINCRKPEDKFHCFLHQHKAIVWKRADSSNGSTFLNAIRAVKLAVLYWISSVGNPSESF